MSIETEERAYPLGQVWRAVVGVLFCALLWGSAFPGIKTAYRIWGEGGVEVTMWTRWWWAGLRFTLAGLLLLPLASRPWAELRRTPKRWLGTMLCCQTFFQYVLFYLALVFGSGSLCALMTASGSFWWLFLAPLFGRAVWGGWRVWLILLVGACGVGLAVYSPEDSSPDAVVAVGLMLAANLCGAVAILVYGRVRETMGARAATGFSLSGGGVLLLVLGIQAAGQTVALLADGVLWITLYLALVSAVAFSVWNELSTRFPVSLLATFRFVIPIFGVMESVIFIQGEEFSWWMGAGALLVVVAMGLAQRLARGGGRG